ncbi:LCP family protein [Candidatus Azambacteria bacterium]|nr:LCP family protein [Candidatus Azambacteria bacterium]
MIINKLSNISENEKKPFWKRAGVFAVVFLMSFAVFVFFKAGHTLSLVNGAGQLWDSIVDDGYVEKNRIDILILGIRGAEDTQYGGTLTDSIMILSIDTKKNETALISVPRDIYTVIPRHDGKREKMNYAYAFGESKGIGGMNLSKQVVEKVTGIVVDYVVVIDFKTFEKLIDTVGGVDLTLDKDFVETSQWGYTFKVPAGKNTLNGETALYYTRSRFSTDDFDRARRQQDVIMALKDKLLNMGVLMNPIKLNEIFDAIGQGVKTNINLATGLELMKYSKYMDKTHLKREVIDASENGLLQAGKVDGAYVLYPKAGLDNFTDIKNEVRNIFQTPSTKSSAE